MNVGRKVSPSTALPKRLKFCRAYETEIYKNEYPTITKQNFFTYFYKVSL